MQHGSSTVPIAYSVEVGNMIYIDVKKFVYSLLIRLIITFSFYVSFEVFS